MKKITKIVIAGSLSLLTVGTAGLVYAGNYLYNLAINNSTDKSLVFSNPNTSNETELEDGSNENFFSSTEYQDILIKSDDGLKLHGYEFTQDSHDYAIVVHGYMSQGNLMNSSSRNFYQRGYNVLVPDLRGHGKSEGDYIAMGWLDRLDIINWIDYIMAKDDQAKIILYGVSMGATTVMNVTGEKLPDNVVLAIEDCGYTSTWDMFEYQLDEMFSLPSHPFLDVANLVTKARAGFWFSEGGAIDQVAKSSTPTLFIHGDDDKFVPFKMLDELYNAAICPKEKLVVEGAGHAQSEDVAKQVYWDAVDQFIKKYKS